LARHEKTVLSNKSFLSLKLDTLHSTIWDLDKKISEIRKPER